MALGDHWQHSKWDSCVLHCNARAVLYYSDCKVSQQVRFLPDPLMNLEVNQLESFASERKFTEVRGPDSPSDSRRTRPKIIPFMRSHLTRARSESHIACQRVGCCADTLAF